MPVSLFRDALATFQLECSWTSAKLELSEDISLFDKSITPEQLSDENVFLYVNDNTNENCRFSSLSHSWDFKECAKNGRNLIIFDHNHEIFSSPKVLFEVECLTSIASGSVQVDNPFRHADENFGIPDVGNVADKSNEDEEDLETVPTLSAFTPLTVPLKFTYTNGGMEVAQANGKLLVDDQVTVSLNLEGLPDGVGGALNKCDIMLGGRKTTIFEGGCAMVHGVEVNSLDSFNFALPFCGDFLSKFINLSCTGSFFTDNTCENEPRVCLNSQKLISC
ncbi:unnamed protein product [Oikopleura dioica]|uniref:Uncharacterized protein n=1 Tax=Oikopleura dioica TaxID=34765 RepID=E4YP58_OIKDI|nr:unnamed protein product [Oikopleura dioica]